MEYEMLEKYVARKKKEWRICKLLQACTCNPERENEALMKRGRAVQHRQPGASGASEAGIVSRV